MDGVSGYMQRAEKRIDEESDNCAKYLGDVSSYQLLKDAVDAALIGDCKVILNGECISYLVEDRQDDLGRMYRLFSRIGPSGCSQMIEHLQDFVSKTGFDAIAGLSQKEALDPRCYVETLLSVYERFNKLVSYAMGRDSEFLAALDRACRKVVNENKVTLNSTRSPELLAKYCDILLKKGNKSHSLVDVEHIEDKLRQIILIFRYLDDKDVFQQFYSKMLARRLIHNTSASDDAESTMIGGLKQACGFEYTSKLQRMFTDITLSSDMQEKFKSYLVDQNLELDIDFSILVLTAGSWPLQTQGTSFTIPGELEKCVKFFHRYYSSQFNGRKLSWLHHLSKGDLKSHYLKKKYEFQVTNYQMSVLLMFNSADTLTMENMLSMSNLSVSELTRTLDSLIHSKLLLVDQTQKPYTSSHSFRLNLNFANKRLRLKLTASLQKETRQENDATHKAIDGDRKLYIQAAIVRIMKARKVLNHVNLVQEVLEQAKSRFQPQIPMVKKCIEYLIEKDYLTRLEGNTDRYQYVA